MPTMLERLAARLAYWHASGVYSRFLKTLRNVDATQQRTLRRVLTPLVRGEYGREHGLASVRTADDLRKAAPLVTYEDLRPWMERLCDGDTGAVFDPSERIHMFATSSGTTARQKLIPVTSEFIRQYRRGWNTFGVKMLTDHPRAILRAILQGSGRYDESRTSTGVPCGAITGLLAREQKGVVRRFYVGTPDIALIGDARAKYYTLMRFAMVRDVAFAITANPATLIRMAQTADEESESLIRDVRDGTLSSQIVSDAPLRQQLEASLKPAPDRARELEKLRAASGALRPRDYWRIEFLACWTGGSMGYYLERLADWWGGVPVRDIGLLASEGRVSIPLEDDNPAGVLDTQGAFFEFLPADRWDDRGAETLVASELETGRDYSVILTNAAGLIRYRLDDIVRVRGWLEKTPLVEFLHRAGRVASVAGEKLTENQVVNAVRSAANCLNIKEFDFVLGPRWSDPPFYHLVCGAINHAELAEQVDQALCEQNDEYSSRRKSRRLGGLQITSDAGSAIRDMDSRLQSERRSTAEQYKRPCLLTDPRQIEHVLGHNPLPG